MRDAADVRSELAHGNDVSGEELYGVAGDLFLDLALDEGSDTCVIGSEHARGPRDFLPARPFMPCQTKAERQPDHGDLAEGPVTNGRRSQ